jgi:hypothetical protein
VRQFLLLSLLILGATQTVHSYVLSNLHLWETGETIPVVFLDATEAEQKKFVSALQTWTRYANLNYKIYPSVESIPTKQNKSIRVSFAGKGLGVGAVAHSSLGAASHRQEQSDNSNLCANRNLPRAIRLRQCSTEVRETALNKKPSIVFSRAFLNSFPKRAAERILLHEIGHTLGFHHEHQHPSFKNLVDPKFCQGQQLSNFCPQEFGAFGMDFSDRPDLNSLMGHGELPSDFFLSPEDRKRLSFTDQCNSGPGLSLGDKLAVSTIYPGRVSESLIRQQQEIDDKIYYREVKNGFIRDYGNKKGLAHYEFFRNFCGERVQISQSL